MYKRPGRTPTVDDNAKSTRQDFQRLFFLSLISPCLSFFLFNFSLIYCGFRFCGFRGLLCFFVVFLCFLNTGYVFFCFVWVSLFSKERKRKKAWGWMDGEVGKLWKGMREQKQPWNILQERDFIFN